MSREPVKSERRGFTKGSLTAEQGFLWVSQSVRGLRGRNGEPFDQHMQHDSLASGVRRAARVNQFVDDGFAVVRKTGLIIMVTNTMRSSNMFLDSASDAWVAANPTAPSTALRVFSWTSHVSPP